MWIFNYEYDNHDGHVHVLYDADVFFGAPQFREVSFLLEWIMIEERAPVRPLFYFLGNSYEVKRTML